jgi:hypothetical protein
VRLIFRSTALKRAGTHQARLNLSKLLVVGHGAVVVFAVGAGLFARASPISLLRRH